MMMIKEKEILDIAKQARININASDAKELIPDVKEILEYFKLLSKADTKDVEETYHPVHVQNQFREDKVEPSLTQEEALSNTKNKKSGYFVGPKTK
jgi:aspartyl-tRNA(Asn)/glutamyl-tRNA(Gln) amidotransferase subunit C